MPIKSQNPLAHLKLGQATDYAECYQPDLLQAVPRALNREPLNILGEKLPFVGVDQWTGYELSWLNLKGLPQVAIAHFLVPASSPNLIESKSFKLYLNSFNHSRFASWDEVKIHLQRDLSECAGQPVEVTLYSLRAFEQMPVAPLPGNSIDSLDISINHYEYEPKLLSIDTTQTVEETLRSDLLKSNCLITNQPDWGSVRISYQGPRINPESLLQYLVSFRHHNEFHEQCVERIFKDLITQCRCQQLTVEARYTRRGGLDINPIRTSLDSWTLSQRTVRQ